LLEQYYGGFEERMEKESGPNIVDCMFFSILQFMKVLYGKDLIAGRPNLVKFYETFKERDSARIPEGYYPEIVSVLAPQWL
jgi:glutathione S-transferase